jgi:hypothetical protein
MFLHQIRSVLALDSSAQATLLSRLRNLGRGDVANNKVRLQQPRHWEALTTLAQLTRALGSISEPPSEMTLEAAIAQVGREIAAVEKLHAAEAQRKEPTKAQDRARREVRIAS